MSTRSVTGIATLFREEETQQSIPTININWRWLRKYGDGIIGGIVLAVLLFAIAFAGQVSPHDPTGAMNLTNRYTPPFWMAEGSLTHPLGTDNLGRDVMSRTLHGGQVSLRVSLIASTIATFLGAVYGLISGYIGGFWDKVLSRLMDMWVAFPFLVLALAVIAAVGSTSTVLIILLAMAGWVYPARVTRAHTLKVRQLDYVLAANAIGGTRLHIVWRHIIPNVIPINIVMWTFSVGMMVVVEGSLSFLGLGVSPPTPSWGNMLSDGRAYLQDAWWLSVIPGMALVLTILCINSLGDALHRMGTHQSNL